MRPARKSSVKGLDKPNGGNIVIASMQHLPYQPSDSDSATLHFFDYWRVISVRWPLCLLAFTLVVITASVVTYLMPRQYAAKVSMEVREADSAITVFSGTGGQRLNPRFLTTQFQIIQHKEVLYPVIKGLELMKVWDQRSIEETYQKLRTAMDVREVRNSDFIEILVYDSDPQLAATIANRIAEEYQRKRIEEPTQDVARSLKQLVDEVSKQQATVDALRKEMSRLRIENGIEDLNPDNIENTAQAESTVLLSVEERVSTERLKNSQLRARAEQIAQMTDDQIMRSSSSLEIKDSTIDTVLPMYQQASAEEARLINSGLGIGHPLVKSLRAKKAVLQRQLADQIVILRRGIAGSLAISDESLKSLETRLAESRTNQQETKSRSETYFEAKAAYLQAKKVLDGLEVKLSTERVQHAMPRSPTTIWEKAEPSAYAARPRVALNLALACVAGLVLGVGLCFFIEYLDTSVKTMADVEQVLQLPVLAVIPKGMSLLMNEGDGNPDAEAYRIMRTNIEFIRKSADKNTITVSSGGPGEGKTTTLCNLAYTFAKGGYSTLVVDGDLRRPSMHRQFCTSNSKGLSDYLLNGEDLDDLVQITKVENLFFLPSGKIPRNSEGILNSGRLQDFLKEAKSKYDLVLFDSPPILGVSDASVLASSVDYTIMVVQHRRFPRSMSQRTMQAINKVGGHIIGVVLNNVDTRHDQYYSYATSYYSYYSKDDESLEAGAGAKPGKANRKKTSPAEKNSKTKDENNDTY